jgi:hypothetical protein
VYYKKSTSALKIFKEMIAEKGTRKKYNENLPEETHTIYSIFATMLISLHPTGAL